MSVFLTLLRKHAAESRWVLGLCCTAFFSLSILTVWLTLLGQRAMAEGGRRSGRAYGFYGRMGGPEMDFSTLAMEVSFWNHPLIVLTVLGWAISRGAAAVGGEIDRGTLDLVLSRPVSRSMYLGSHVAFAVLGLIALVTALIAGNVIGSLFIHVSSPPGVLKLIRPAIMVVTLGMAAYGYTLPFSAMDVVRWRPGVVAAGITLGGLTAMIVAAQFEGYEWLERLSIFRAYAPVTVAVKGVPLGYNGSVLTLLFALGTALSFLLFTTRDLPTNS